MGNSDEDDAENIQKAKDDKFVKIFMAPSATDSNYQKKTSREVDMNILEADIKARMGIDNTPD